MKNLKNTKLIHFIGFVVSSFTICFASAQSLAGDLAVAAKKHSVKHRFYYSHAFDWEHSHAPGNDWKYKNPGGDSNLHCGREWYDLHPGLLMKAQRYVNGKAIPLVKESLAKCHPGVLWFEVKPDIQLPKIFAEAEQQTKLMLAEIPKAKAARSTVSTGGTPGSAGADIVSPRTLDSGRLRLVTSRDWTSGFFPGVLWYLYEYTKKEEWKKVAENFTALMEKEKTNSTTHDMGFKVYCSFGTGYALTKNAYYRDVISESAKTLSTRFSKTAGVLRSWDHSKQKWDFPVIIDNMMNLELLFAATRFTGDSSFYKIAVSHADNTMKNHFRADNSSYHVVDYDSTGYGKINKKTTHQGYSNESAWSRGQAWGLYGYTMCYRETKKKAYLDQAEKIAAFMLNHPNMPKDLVPYWDFNAPNIPAEPKDASAAAIAASSLYELSLYSKNSKQYRAAADKIIESLTKTYRAPVGEAKGFILLHSTGSKPSNSEVDAPLSYADYYYLEALLRMKKLKEGKKLF